MTQKFEYFGKYILLEKLATGGMAEVFLARKTGADGIGKFCAIKRILPQFAESPEFIDMFRDEAKIAINLSHSNIVSLHEFGVEKDQFFIVMDYVEGRNLRQILNKMKKNTAKFSMDQIIFIIKEIAGGLDHAHRCLDGSTGKPLNITHRDMSPQNVMVSFEGEIKIVDFGIAKAESQMETTRAGTLKGKFGYMSPEQAEGQPVDLRTDIFSLGIVLWELLANDRLFIANNEINTLRKIRDCQIPSLRKINPNIPAELDRIVQKALARDRNLRYQTAAALHRDLNRFLNRQYPDFSPHDFSVFIKTLFADEILNTRKRIIEYSKIPFRNQEERKERPVKEDTSENLMSGTQTSSFVSVKMKKAPEPQPAEKKAAEIPELRRNPLKKGPPEQNRFAPIDEPDIVEPSLDIKSFSRSQEIPKDEKLHPPKQLAPEKPIREAEKLIPEDDEGPTEISNSAIGVLDENALEKAMAKKINVKASNPYVLETEEPIERSYTGTGHHTQWTRSTYRAKKRISINYLSIMMFASMTLSSYALMAKFMPEPMSPVVRRLDVVLSPVHRVLGITGQSQISSNNPKASNENSNPGQTNGNISISGSPDEVFINEEFKQLPQQDPTADNKKAVAPVENNDSLPPPPFGQTDMVISSNPSGAEIYINGRNTQKITPSRVTVPSGGEFTLELKRSGYIDYVSENMNLAQTGRKFTATLQKAMIGYVNIDVRPPSGAKVWVNDKLLEERSLPIRGYPVPANTNITIRAENPLQKWSTQRTLTVKPDQRSSVILDLRNSSRHPSQRR